MWLIQSLFGMLGVIYPRATDSVLRNEHTETLKNEHERKRICVLEAGFDWSLTLDGTRTRNRWIRSPTPYPLGHESTACYCVLDYG